MNSKKTLSTLTLAAGSLVASLAFAQATPGGMGSQGTAMPDAPMPASPAPAGAMPDHKMPAKPAAKSKAAMPAAAPASSGQMGSASPYTPKAWGKGDQLPAEFRDRQYVIDDWKQYNLPAPKKGLHWVGIGAEYYLVMPNGKIAQVGASGS